MTAVASEGVAGRRHQLRQRLRSTVLGPRGGGTTRRRASDAFRLALAVVVVLVSIPVMRANSAVELSIVRAVHPPPAAISWLVTSVLAGICGGQALPVNAITDLRIRARDITRAPRQVWGVELFTGRDEAGEAIELAVYGRDASDARVLAKLWRFCLYRDSGPTLILDRLQQVEHEAYLTLTAGRSGVLVPDVLAAGRFGPSRDAALVTGVPDGLALSQAEGADLADATLDEILLAAIVGGAVPVPGGLGVVEAGLIAGLTSAGVPQDQAVAAVLIQRFFTSYLPPAWGWATLAWMRRREYV